MKPPAHIRNIDLWESNCRRIHARAVDLLEGRSGIIESARELTRLAFWAGLEEDDDLSTFVGIDSETGSLPVGEVRKLWADYALERYDAEIRRAEELYRPVALESASRLRERFAWALEARNLRREGRNG